MNSFNTRETYLAAVAAWKLEYATQITLIRKLKIDFKTTQRAFAKCGSYKWSAKTDEERASNKAYLEAERVMHAAQVDRNKASSAATEMLVERANGKIEAQKQWAQAHS